MSRPASGSGRDDVGDAAFPNDGGAPILEVVHSVLALVLTAAGPVLAPAVPAPGIAGTWALVPQHSDDVQDGIVASLGPDYAAGDARADSARHWIRAWMLAQAETPERRVLTIERTPTEFRTIVGDEVRVYYFGRETLRQESGGGARRRSTVRNEGGGRVVVEERAEKGSGRIVERYELSADGRTLLLTWRLEHKGMRQPLVLRLAFARALP